MQKEALILRGKAGISLAAEACGGKNAMPVLLAHGGGQTRRAWKRVMCDLAQGGFRAIAVDLRGHGDSEWALEGAYEVQDFAADLVNIASLMKRRPALVGASLGGMAGILAEGDLAPGTFASLTLVDTVPRMEPDGVMRVVGFMEEHIDSGFASPQEAADVIARYMPHRARRGASDGLNRYLRQKEDGRFYWHWDPCFIRNIAASRRSDPDSQERQSRMLSKAAANLTLPLHLIRGTSSDLVSEEAVSHLRQLAPHTEYSDIADASHMVVGDANDAFSDAIQHFLVHHHVADLPLRQGSIA